MNCLTLKALGQQLEENYQTLGELESRDFLGRASIFTRIAELHSAISGHRDSCSECRQVDLSVHPHAADAVSMVRR